MRRFARLTGAVLAIALAAAGAAPSLAAKTKGDAKPKAEWNQIDNVKDAAKRMGELHRRQGAEAALKFLEACYKTHTIAEKFTEGLEACMAQDYMLSQMLAVIYSKVSSEALKQMHAPTADVISQSMRGRFQAIFAQYKFSQEQADNLKKAVDTYGMPIFVKTVFPKKRGDGGKDGKDGGGANEGAPSIKLPLPEAAPAAPVPPADAPPGDGK